MNKKFDFSEIDGALPTAEKMQEQDRIIDALKNNYEAVRILSANVEKLENRLSEALPKMDGAVSSLRGHHQRHPPRPRHPCSGAVPYRGRRAGSVGEGQRHRLQERDAGLWPAAYAGADAHAGRHVLV